MNHPSADTNAALSMHRRWLWWLNALALLAALATTCAHILSTGISNALQHWLGVALVQIAPAIGIGGFALLALRRLRGRIAIWSCGIGAALASMFWIYSYIELGRSTARDAGLGIALLPIALLPIWGGLIGFVLLSEWIEAKRRSRTS